MDRKKKFKVTFFVATGCFFLLLILIFVTVYPEYLKKEKERTFLIQNIFQQVIITNRDLTLTGEEMAKFIAEVSQKSLPAQHTHSILEDKVYFKAISKNVAYSYAIAPDSSIRGNFWLFREKNDFKINELSLFHSEWLLQFLEENGLMYYENY